jgi:hypothetical protein
VTAPWFAAAIAAAVLALALLVHAINLSFRVGVNVRDTETNTRDIHMFKRIMGLENGTEAMFVRADVAEARYAALLGRFDALLEDNKESAKERALLRDQLTEIKLLLAQRKEG